MTIWEFRYTISQKAFPPQKPDSAIYKQPLDILVTFTSISGKKVHFSLNELLITDDSRPVTLAYIRKEVMPTTEAVRENYAFNLFRENLSGLKVICPRESDTSRYLDNVVTVTCTTPPVPDHLLPARTKRGKCTGESIQCIENRESRTASFQGVIPAKKMIIGEESVTAMGLKMLPRLAGTTCGLF